MLKAILNRASAPLAMGVLLAALGFTYALATPEVGGRAIEDPPTCTLPEFVVITGSDTDTLPACYDLGDAVVNRQFTRRINVRDGYPPYEFSTVAPLPDNCTLSIDSATGILTGILRAPTPEVHDGAILYADYDASCLPVNDVMFTIRVEDQNPDPLAKNLEDIIYCMTVEPILEGGLPFIEDATNVVTPSTVGSGGVRFPPPIAFPTDSSADMLMNDLPTGLQRSPYQYQLHANGGDRFGGGSLSTTFTPISVGDASNFAGFITPNASGIHSGLNGSATYTFEVDELSGTLGGSAVFLDLVVTSSNDIGLAGSTQQVFLDVFDPTFVQGVTTPVFLVPQLCVGSLGIIINLSNPVLANAPPDSDTTQDNIHDGDIWRITYEAFTPPDVEFFLDQDSPQLPEGMSISIDGLISGTPSRAGDYTFLIEMIKYNSDTGDEEDRITQQFFLRINPGPVTSQFVLTQASGRIDFGKLSADQLRLSMFVAKDILRSGAQLNGATLEIVIGQGEDTFTLSEHISGTLALGIGGGVSWPPKLLSGQPTNLYAGDARVLVDNFNPNTGLIKIFMAGLDLKDTLADATDIAVLAGTYPLLEIPMTVSITGGSGNLALRFDEIVTFDFTQRSSVGLLSLPKGPLAATTGIGQFMVNAASGRIVFDPTTASDTLALTLKGFIRAPDRAPIDLTGLLDANNRLEMLLGGQCVLHVDPMETADFAKVSATGFAIKTKSATIPVQLFQVNNKTGAFIIKTRAPATNAAIIQGAQDPGGADPGLVINAVHPFDISVVFRVVDNATDLPINGYDFRYTVTMFRHGTSLNLK
ncbi:MAG: hypothetical protein AMXMBFR7_05390 [Planctomycetota bacterium]